jgi:hypothetical protein
VAITVAALFVETNGVYFGLDDVEPWDIRRDARLYRGPHPVVCHSPCQRWSRYWSGGPNPNARRFELGDDGGCFTSALRSVRQFGGVLEHPEASHAFKYFALPLPPKSGGWVRDIDRGFQAGVAWSCCVEQGHYGHPARKATWLYYVGDNPPPDLIWGPSSGQRLDEGFHSKAERDAARAAGIKPCKRLSKAQNLATPIAFRDVLLGIARSVSSARSAA